MRLYLAQHGDAVPEAEDGKRPLSERGRADVARLAEFLQRAGVRAGHVHHSGKLRARQTAERLAEAVMPGGRTTVVADIAPNDPVAPLAELAGRWSVDTLVVGHMPFVGRLAARLLTGREEPPVAAFRPGAVICLERDAAGAWRIAWMVAPELLSPPA